MVLIFRAISLREVIINTPIILDDKLTTEQIAAQAFVFLLAGFETSGLTIQYALYELAQNPEMQEKLRAEIKDSLATNNGKLTYESYWEMKYLERIVDGKVVQRTGFRTSTNPSLFLARLSFIQSKYG